MNIGDLILALTGQGGVTPPTPATSAEKFRQQMIASGIEDDSGLDNIVSEFSRARNEAQKDIDAGPGATPVPGPKPDPTAPDPATLPLPPQLQPQTPPNPNLRPATTSVTSAGPTPPIPVKQDEPVPTGLPTTPPIAEAYKSPPDMVEMYIKLMEKSRNAAAMDSGLTLIAAAFAHPQNRPALIQAATSGGGGGDGVGGLSMANIIEMQKMQQAEAERAGQRAQLPALMKQYGLDQATVTYLDSTGQLDETLKELASPDTEVVEKADGSKMLINKRTGETVKELSAAKPRATEYVDDPSGKGGRVLIYTDDRTRVDNGTKVTSIAAPPRETEWIDDPSGEGGKIKVYKDDSTPVPSEGGAITRIARPKGDITVEKLANGKLQAYQDGRPVFEPYGPETDVSTEDMKELLQLNQQRVADGLEPYRLDEWIERRTSLGTEAGTQAQLDKTRYGTPPAGQYFIRDETGAVLTNPDGTPRTAWDTNSAEYKEMQRREEELRISRAEEERKAKEAETEAAKAEEGEANKRVRSTIVTDDINRAKDIIEAHRGLSIPVTGALAPSGVGGTDAFTLAKRLETIKGNMGMDQLLALRNASETGAGVGPVSDYENRLFQGLLGSLDQGLNQDELIYNLNRIDAAVDLFINGVEDPPGSGKYRGIESSADIDNAMKASNAPPPPAETTPPKREDFTIEKVEPTARTPRKNEPGYVPGFGEPGFNPKQWPPT